MSESLRELAAWYPLLPAGPTIPTIAKVTLDMRVVIPLPAVDYLIHGASQQAVNVGRAVLTAYNAGAYTVTVYTARHKGAASTDPDPIVISVPVYIGRDARPPQGSSYVICSSQPPEAAGLYEIHPDCLVFMQDKPYVEFFLRGPVTSVDGHASDHGRIDGKTTLPSGATLSQLSFEDGFNVGVSATTSSLTFTGIAGGGAGIWVESPYVDIPEWNTQAGSGLRSINGQTGAVTILGNQSVTITAREDMNDNQQTITVSLQPVSNVQI